MADRGLNTDLLSVEANDTQHDAVLDYYGRRLATCSSDKTIKIFEVEGEKHTLVETLRGYVMVGHLARFPLVDSSLDTRVLFGASPGHIRNMETFSPRLLMTEKSSSGANSPIPGRRSMR